jgi:hypothetical protein
LCLRQFGAEALHRCFKPVDFGLMTLRIGDTLVVCLFDAYLKSRDLLAQAIDFGAQAVALNGFASDLGD